MCVSAHVKERDKKNAYEAGVDLFVGKPVPPNELVNSIDSLIKEKLNSAILKER
jgi:DNA-binding response OmpR family regulator